MPNFDLASIIRELAIVAVPFLLAITCHEVAHGYVAYLLGDPTAKNQGRLTLNPLKHLDVVGTLVLVMTRMIGWAKPVPVDWRYFKNPQKGMMLVSVAGPGANFALAVLFSLAFTLSAQMLQSATSKTMADILFPLALICRAGVTINLVLGCFNLLPIPPLDGSNIVAGVLPPHAADRYLSFGRYGFVIILLLAVTGLLGQLLLPMVRAVGSILL